MDNMYKYIENYGNMTFWEKDLTTIDILIFSQIPYLDFSKIIWEKGIGIRLKDAWDAVKDANKVSKGIAQKNAIKLLNLISKVPRYSDLILKNYEYRLTDATQFGAITVELPNKVSCVCFEGTDDSITGWKEDFQLAYTYPTESQVLAGDYLNKTIKLYGHKVIVCGHSKGGNLALVGAMKTAIFKKPKIQKIYSFDGPGLKLKEFKSLNYKLVRNRLVNIIPNGSLVGIILEQENVQVIKSRGFGLYQHDTSTWVIDKDEFKSATQDRLSKRFDECLNRWLLKYDYKEREEIIEGIFSIFDASNIKSTRDIRVNKLKSFYAIVKSSMDMSKETRDVILGSIKLLVTDFGTDVINDSKKMVSDTINKHFKRDTSE